MEATLLTSADSDKTMHPDVRRMFDDNSFPDTRIEGPATNTHIPQPQSREELAERLTAVAASGAGLF